ncbi:MAG: CopG family transcriptional regulator [Dongiaceae bacterium]
MAKKHEKVRHQLFLPADVTEKLEALAAKPGCSKSAILTDALVAWLGRWAGHELDDRFGVRLNRISMQLGRIERDGQVLLESLALFIRYQLNVTAPLPEADAAARAVGRDRFQAFIEQVARQLARGDRTLDRSAVGPDEPQPEGES